MCPKWYLISMTVVNMRECVLSPVSGSVNRPWSIQLDSNHRDQSCTELWDFRYSPTQSILEEERNSTWCQPAARCIQVNTKLRLHSNTRTNIDYKPKTDAFVLFSPGYCRLGLLFFCLRPLRMKVTLSARLSMTLGRSAGSLRSPCKVLILRFVQ